MDKVPLVRKQEQSLGIRIEPSYRLDAHRREAVRQQGINRLVVARVVAALDVHRLVEHHVQLLYGRDLLAVYRDIGRALLELHERVLENVAIQFDKAHAHKSPGLLAATESDTREKTVQGQCGHQSSTMNLRIFLRINPSSTSSPVRSTCLRRFLNIR